MPDPQADDLLARALALPGVDRVAGVPGVHLVGGAVRDLRLGGRPDDLDLVVEGELDDVLARLAGARVVHDRFGTATVREDGHRIDVTRARTERYARPGALPEVRPAGIEDDLRRRDFTVNTFALELATGRERSADGAEDDLRAGVLRVLHPRSFADDPTRLLRLARYRARLSFHIEPGTAESARAAVAARAPATVSDDRLGTELRLLAREGEALDAFGVLAELGVDAALDPGFGLRDGEEASTALALLPADGRRDVLLLALACRDVGDPGGLLRRLGFRAEDARAVRAALAAPADLAGASPGRVAEALSTPEQAALAGVRGAEAEARRWLEETRHVRLEVTGNDLRAAGVPEGPALGDALRELLRLKRDGLVHGGREEELRAALRILGR